MPKHFYVHYYDSWYDTEHEYYAGPYTCPKRATEVLDNLLKMGATRGVIIPDVKIPKEVLEGFLTPA